MKLDLISLTGKASGHTLLELAVRNKNIGGMSLEQYYRQVSADIKLKNDMINSRFVSSECRGYQDLYY